MKKIGIVFIGTGLYAGFFDGFYKRVKRYFCSTEEKTFFVFTDLVNHPYFQDKHDVDINEISHVEWPFITLHRFKFMNSIKEKLSKMDYVVFIDADLWPIEETNLSELTFDSSKDLFGVQHPGFIGKEGTFEDNEKSRAYSYNQGFDLSNYWQGCFWGGKSNKILEMISILEERVDKDYEEGVVAKWHDESHTNKFFLENKNSVLTLHPGFALPEANGYEMVWNSFQPKMIHLDKDPKNFPRFEGLKK